LIITKDNNCKLKQYSGRLPEGIHHQSWSPERIRVIIITITNRQNIDKQNHTIGKKEKGGVTKGIRSIGKQSGQSVESVRKKKRKATVGRICKKRKVLSLQ